MANARIYIVTSVKGPSKTTRLIRATSEPAAISYCARQLYEARVARAQDLTEALIKGATVEDAVEPVISGVDGGP